MLGMYISVDGKFCILEGSGSCGMLAGGSAASISSSIAAKLSSSRPERSGCGGGVCIEPAIIAVYSEQRGSQSRPCRDCFVI